MALADIRLDRSRHFAIVTPPENGAHFHQDGLYFTHGGEVVEDMIDEAGVKAIKRRNAQAAAKAAAEDAYRKALEEQGMEPDAIKGEIERVKNAGALTDAAAGAANSQAVDLIAWAKGHKQYPWFTVRKAFTDQHSRDVENKANALDFLADEGLIAPEDINI